MAKDNSNNTQRNEEQREEAHMMITSFNSGGFAPVASTFQLTPNQLKAEILAIAQSFISDFTDCTIDTNRNTGTVYAYVWIANNSEHVRDNSTMDANSAIKKPIPRYSKEFKEFMDKFCRGDKRTYPDDRGLGKLALDVDILRFINIIFDRYGNEYSKKYGGRPQKTEVGITAHFGKSENGKFGNLRYISIQKSTYNSNRSTEPRPKKSLGL